MNMKLIRSRWKHIAGKQSKFCRKDLELYVEQCKNYLTTPWPGVFGICWYTDQQGADVGNKSTYTLWAAMSIVKGSVADLWQQELDDRRHFGGRTTARVAMTKRLIAELEAVIAKDKRKR